MRTPLKYFYSLNGTETFGPHSLEEIIALKPHDETLIWHEDLEDFISFKNFKKKLGLADMEFTEARFVSMPQIPVVIQSPIISDRPPLPPIPVVVAPANQQVLTSFPQVITHTQVPTQVIPPLPQVISAPQFSPIPSAINVTIPIHLPPIPTYTPPPASDTSAPKKVPNLTQVMVTDSEDVEGVPKAVTAKVSSPKPAPPKPKAPTAPAAPKNKTIKRSSVNMEEVRFKISNFFSNKPYAVIPGTDSPITKITEIPNSKYPRWATLTLALLILFAGFLFFHKSNQAQRIIASVKSGNYSKITPPIRDFLNKLQKLLK